MPKLIDIKSLKKKPFSVVNKANNISEILLYGAIGESFWEDSISLKQFKDALKEIPDSTKEIQLRVNSPGGSVFDGMSMYELIKAEKKKGKKVVAYIDGLAASIASVIILAADEIIVGEGSMVMIHKPLVGAYGNSLELERMVNILDKIEEQMITIYSKKTGISRAEISNMLSAETWMTSNEALDNGFADSQFAACDTLHIAASLIERSTHFNKKPNMKNSDVLVKNKLAEFNAKAKEYLKTKNIK
jgi:ATP-dependent Clp endopeptidase proteolytic subunit ClpP